VSSLNNCFELCQKAKSKKQKAKSQKRVKIEWLETLKSSFFQVKVLLRLINPSFALNPNNLSRIKFNPIWLKG
jgi:hypothetical protein